VLTPATARKLAVALLTHAGQIDPGIDITWPPPTISMGEEPTEK
jgi:hypothetical protein